MLCGGANEICEKFAALVPWDTEKLFECTQLFGTKDLGHRNGRLMPGVIYGVPFTEWHLDASTLRHPGETIHTIYQRHPQEAIFHSGIHRGPQQS